MSVFGLHGLKLVCPPCPRGHFGGSEGVRKRKELRMLSSSFFSEESQKDSPAQDSDLWSLRLSSEAISRQQLHSTASLKFCIARMLLSHNSGGPPQIDPAE